MATAPGTEAGTRPRHPTLGRIVRRLKPSAESFAAAAAVYGPDLLLHLAATQDAPPTSDPPSASRTQGKEGLE